MAFIYSFLKKKNEASDAISLQVFGRFLRPKEGLDAKFQFRAAALDQGLGLLIFYVTVARPRS